MHPVVICIINQSNTLHSKFFKHDDAKELTEENGISITDMGKMSIFLSCYLVDIINVKAKEREFRYHFLLILAEIDKLEYNESDFVEDTVHRQLGYRPEERLPDIKSVRETQRLDNDNMDYKKPPKNGII